MSLPSSVNELMAGARALVPELRERALACEAARTLPPETVADLRALRLPRILQPARRGGLELGLRALARVGEELAQGCGSSAWCLALFGTSSRLVGLFPGPAQDEVLGGDGDALVTAVHAATGTATADHRDGGPGFRLEGRWQYASGADHATWMALTATVQHPAPRPLPDVRCFLVPAAEVKIDPTWSAFGLRGTGSHDVVVDGAFVPAHRVLALIDVARGAPPGAAVNPTPLYRLPIIPVLALAVAGPAIGLALECITEFRERSFARRPGFGASVQATRTTTQVRLARAMIEVDAARSVLDLAIGDLEAAAATGPVDRLAQARARLDAAWVVATSARVVDDLFADSGAGAGVDSSPLQRAFRDVHAIAAHGALQFDPAAEVYGRLVLGLSADAALF
jgi:3-hydroxy-9,10-secoandrosta-1,3,5(10)-triene-9,17-dione monooxygenase